MKKILVLVAVMFTGLGFSQKDELVLEAEGKLVKATYFYDNGNVQQVGHFKDGKLDGKWTSYEENGNVKSIAEYKDGEKFGKWMHYSNNVCTSEVSFSDNRIVAVKNVNKNAIALKD